MSSSYCLCDICSPYRGRDASNTGSGPEFFGFSHPTIQYLIQSLPGARKCTKYQWVKFELPKPQNKPGKEVFSSHVKRIVLLQNGAIMRALFSILWTRILLFSKLCWHNDATFVLGDQYIQFNIQVGKQITWFTCLMLLKQWGRKKTALEGAVYQRGLRGTKYRICTRVERGTLIVMITTDS